MGKVFARNSSSKNLSPKVLWRELEKQTLEQRFWELQFRKSKKIICRNQINRKILACFKIFILIFQIEQFRKERTKIFGVSQPTKKSLSRGSKVPWDIKMISGFQDSGSLGLSRIYPQAFPKILKSFSQTQNLKTWSRIPRIGIRDPEKISGRSEPWFRTCFFGKDKKFAFPAIKILF